MTMVNDLIQKWNAGFSPAVGGTKGTKPEPKKPATKNASGSPQVSAAKPSNRDKVACPSCGKSYNGRAKWVQEGRASCFSCASPKGAK